MSKLLKGLVVSVLAAGSVASGGAFAADAEKDPATAKVAPRAESSRGKGGFGMMRLKRLDADKNGAISKDEFLSPRLGEFKTLDANSDKTVEPSEIGVSLQEPAEFRTRRFVKRVDANRDGKITREEFEQGPRAMFAGRDINSDGKINAQDRPPSSGTGMGWFGGGEGKKMGLGAGRAGRPDVTLDSVVAKTQAEFNKIDGNSDGTLDASELAKQGAERVAFSKTRMMHWSDQNKDGKLTEEEFTARTVKRFATLDLNDDGQIDGSDFPSAARKGWFSR